MSMSLRSLWLKALGVEKEVFTEVNLRKGITQEDPLGSKLTPVLKMQF